MCSYWDCKPGSTIKIGEVKYLVLDRDSHNFTLKTLNGRYVNSVNVVDKNKVMSKDWDAQLIGG